MNIFTIYKMYSKGRVKVNRCIKSRNILKISLWNYNLPLYCKSTKFRDRFNFANFAVAYQLNRII